ncbi:1,4-dihydroxy-2-naphthoate polyprenyltransferase [Coraliomargarita sinensis]|uniref:1,4-dihydroxy-2-naphthoate octaprenyltransferase n=1 Tax=Coraliomargarita sinensis TaxID=2174842 RepID=A0A317ZH32_9BACT|nr:1,4-dihydroxy-2-naphthoate polyprenyltransferase [Coraliomargarita sinensis]PXA03099.1 1,4-dihydroxy-2-naphthoate polyprenyltransferase [Coraliomargarita sinensis]
MSKIPVWLEATRPKTLSAAVCPVLVGTSLAWHAGLFDWRPALICLFFALLVQIGTNFANDYLDGVKGSDTQKRIGPQRAVASGLVRADSMKRAALVVLGAAFCLGLLLIPFGGWWLLAVGVVSVLCAWCYTGGPYPLAYNGLGDVFVILFFGFIAVGCTYFVQAGPPDWVVYWSGFACGLLINNILVVNNYRDVEEDLVSGKKTLAVSFGRTFALWQYRTTVFTVAMITCCLSVALQNRLLPLALLALIPAALLAWRLPELHSSDEYLAALKTSGVVVAAYGLVFSAALAF